MLRALALASLLLLAAPAGVSAQEPDSEPTPSSQPTQIPDLAEPDPALGDVLDRLEGDDEPQRHLARSFVALIHYLLVGDLERLLPHFHPQLQFHVGGGTLEPMPPEELREQLSAQLAQRDEGPTPAVQTVVDLGSVRVYSRQRARTLDPADEGWELQLGRVGNMMQEGDWLVVARTKEAQWGEAEAFFVFRRDADDPHGRYKVVLSD